ncbi:VOC family protein, partial [Patescibacteria group bacterium]|nr:VOC family protein [Patescibacteria group bacterium]
MSTYGLHHVTAVTATAKENLTFYTKILGMRLVKKTVNQDDVSAYHLFYADAEGNPGTDMTFFDWPRAGEHK